MKPKKNVFKIYNSKFFSLDQWVEGCVLQITVKKAQQDIIYGYRNLSMQKYWPVKTKEIRYQSLSKSTLLIRATRNVEANFW